LCPGRIDRKLSSFGAPRKIDGIKSMKMCVMDKLTMKIAKDNGGRIVRRNGEAERRKVATRFIWMPGKRPVKVPMAIPRARAIIISNNI
jgi:hypothetical protein